MAINKKGQQIRFPLLYCCFQIRDPGCKNNRIRNAVFVFSTVLRTVFIDFFYVGPEGY
jgi:hypothetical protein